VESEIGALEAEVNAWIRERGARIVSITGNIAPQSNTPQSKGSGALGTVYPPSDVVIIVLYETTE
jgi:hypothetical protein